MQPQTKAYTAIAATGALPVLPLAGAPRTFALQVAIPSGAITSWSVNLDGSLDGVNWTTLVTHNAAIGSTTRAIDKPVTFVRVNVTALALNTAPSITVLLVATP